jgi:uncharacterized protein YdaU (DUF1376 family)
MSYYWTAFDWGAYDRKTAHLTLAEDGAYRRLLSHYYQNRKPLPANAELLLRVCRAFAEHEKAAVAAVLAEFFTLEADGYHNRRCDEELSKLSQVSEKRRVAGKKGAETTNRKKSAIAAILPNRLPTQLQPQLQQQIKEQTPVDSDHIVLSIAKAYPECTYENEFQIRGAEADAIIYAIEQEEGDHQKIIAGVKRYAASITNPNMVMGMDKFFNKLQHRRQWDGGENKPISKLEQLRALRKADGQNGLELAEQHGRSVDGKDQGGGIPRRI